MPLGNRKKEKVEFQFAVKVDLKKEWAQIFEESWRVMKYLFYDENMHGFDWEKIKADYKDGVLNVTLPKREEAKPKQISISVGK